jgi:malate/lactate dehydrogenase
LNESKVILIGNGRVGGAFAYAAVNQETVSQLGIIDMAKEYTDADIWDLSDGIIASDSQTRVFAADYSDTKDADIIVITAGIAQTDPTQSRLDLLEKNKTIFTQIVSQALENGFDGIFVVATNPCDVLSKHVLDISKFPSNRVISTGTLIDSSRFKRFIAQKKNVHPSQVTANVIGEHGDSQVLVYSSVLIDNQPVTFTAEEKAYISDQTIRAGLYISGYGSTMINKAWRTRMAEVVNVSEDDIKLEGDLDFPLPDLRNVLAGDQYITNVVLKTGRVMTERDKKYISGTFKGATWQGIGMSINRIVKAILNDESVIIPVGSYFEAEGVYASWPTLVDKTGIVARADLAIDAQEKAEFEQSLAILKSY